MRALVTRHESSDEVEVSRMTHAAHAKGHAPSASCRGNHLAVSTAVDAIGLQPVPLLKLEGSILQHPPPRGLRLHYRVLVGLRLGSHGIGWLLRAVMGSGFYSQSRAGADSYVQ